MKKLYIAPTTTTPEISFSPEENIFFIKGNSSPEDVRALYYPVIEWIKELSKSIINENYLSFSTDNPLKLSVDLEYFNSSSAKFLLDIFTELKQLISSGISVKIDWYYEKEDLDMKDAGKDISTLVEMEFQYIPK
jgi:hypothetical protein